MSIAIEELKEVLNAASDMYSHNKEFDATHFVCAVVGELYDRRKEQSIAKASATAQSLLDKAINECAKKAKAERSTIDGAGNEQMLNGESVREDLKALNDKDVAYCEKDKWGDGWIVFNKRGKGKFVFLHAVSESTARHVCELVNA